MQTGDNSKGKSLSPNQKLAITLIIAIVALSGCVRSAQKPDTTVPPVARKDEIVLENPALSPSVVSVGGTLRQELKYSLSAAKGGKLKVSEVIIISGKGLKMELSKRESEREQGDHLSTFQFKVPKGLPPGDYQLITTIAFGRETRNATGNFRVKR